MRKTLIKRTILATLGLASSAVLAHTGEMAHAHGGDAMSSFFQAALHPLTGLDHLAAMVSVGLWSALTARHGRDGSSRGVSRTMWAAPAAFAATLLVGALLGLGGLKLPGVEPMIAASLLILGLLVCTRTALPTLAGGVLVSGFALFHGLAHGAELAGTHAAAALTGMALSTAGLHALGIAIGMGLRNSQAGTRGSQGARQWASRVAGACVAVFGAALLTPAVASAF